MANKTYTTRIQLLGVDEADSSIKDLTKNLRKLKDQQAKEDIGSQQFIELANNIAEVQAQLNGASKAQKALTASFEATQNVAGSFGALKAETKELTLQFAQLAVGVNATQEEYDELALKIQKNNLQILDISRNLRGSRSLFENIRTAGIAAFKDIALQATGALTAVQGFNAIKGLGSEFLEIERGYAQVNTVAQLSNAELEKLQKTTLAYAKESPVDLQQVPQSLFKILSATGDVTLSQDILRQSLRASKAGFAELNEASDAGTQIFSAVKNQVSGAEEVFDVLFRTQKEGVLTFADLAKEVPRVIPSANQAGFAFKEVAASLATVTKAGLNANQSATVLDALFREIADPAKAKGFKAIGASIFDSAGKTRPLLDIVGDLNKALVNLNPEEKAQALKQIGLGGEASKGLGVLLNDIKTFGSVSTSVIEGSTGELNRQFLASANTSDDLKIAVNNLKLTLIDELAPAFTGVAKTGVGLLNGLAKLIVGLVENRNIIFLLTGAIVAYNAARIQQAIVTSASTKGTVLNTVVTAANNAAIRIAAAGQAIYTTAVRLFTGQVTIATLAQQALNVVLNANPFGLVIGGATALAAVYLLLANRSKELTREQQIVADLQKEVTDGYAKESAASARLFLTLKDETSTREQRATAMQQINEQYGEYLPSLLTEASSLQDVEKAQNAVNEALLRKIQLQVQEQAITRQVELQQRALLDGAQSLSTATGVTAESIRNAATQISKVIQGASQEQSLAVLKATDDYEGLLNALANTAGVGQDVRKTLAAINIKGEALNFLDLAGVVGQTNREIKIINDSFSNTGIIGAFGDEISSTGAAFGEAAETVATLTAKIKALQDQQQQVSTAKDWKTIQKEIDATQKKIDAIIGKSGKVDKGAQKSAEEKAKQEELNATNLFNLRRQLRDLEIASIEDQTERELALEDQKYQDLQQKALDNAAAIISNEQATASQREQAIADQNAILAQLEVAHAANVNQIRQDGAERSIANEERLLKIREQQQMNVFSITEDTLKKELELAEKDFQKKKQILEKQKDLRLKVLEAELSSNIKAAKSDDERTALMENAANERKLILKNFVADVEEGRKDQGSLLSRILGIDEETLAEFGNVFSGFQDTALQAIDQFFDRQFALIDTRVEEGKAKIEQLNASIEAQQQRIADAQEELEEAQGERRQRLIQLIEKEKLRESALQAERVKNAEEVEKLERKKAQLEQQQAAIRKTQAIGQAVVNTAVAITRVFAETPPPASFVLAALYGALGAAQIATISAQKFQDGGLLTGNRHSDGGVPIIVGGRRQVEAEGGEFVVQRNATSKNIDAINTINADRGRTKFDLVPASTSSGMFANGGRLTADTTKMASAAQSGISRDMLNELKSIREAIEDMPPVAVPVDSISTIQRDTNRRKRNASFS